MTPEEEKAELERKSKYANGRVPKLGDHVVHVPTGTLTQITSFHGKDFSKYLHEEDHN